MANIAEGFDRGGDKEFIQFLSNSKGSCGEVKSHLYVALDQQYVTPVQFNQLYERADGRATHRWLYGLLATIRPAWSQIQA